MVGARRAKPETTNAYCPVCSSVAGEPCYRVKRLDSGSLKRMGVLEKIHDKRPGAVKNRKPAKNAGKTATKTAARNPTEIRATRPGSCSTCCRPINVGAPITAHDGTWVHTECAVFEANRAAVLSGNTFAAQKPSDWRLGASPSSRARPPARLPGPAAPEPTYQGPVVPIERIDPGRQIAVGRQPSALPQLGKRAHVDNGGGVQSRPSGSLPIPTRRQSRQIEIQAASVTDDEAVSVPCATCRALVGQPCRSATGKPIVKVHFARRQHVARMAN